jgi:hypothetical protein
MMPSTLNLSLTDSCGRSSTPIMGTAMYATPSDSCAICCGSASAARVDPKTASKRLS